MTSMYMLQQLFTKSYEFKGGEFMNITTQNRVFIQNSGCLHLFTA